MIVITVPETCIENTGMDLSILGSSRKIIPEHSVKQTKAFADSGCDVEDIGTAKKLEEYLLAGFLKT